MFLRLEWRLYDSAGVPSCEDVTVWTLCAFTSPETAKMEEETERTTDSVALDSLLANKCFGILMFSEIHEIFHTKYWHLFKILHK